MYNLCQQAQSPTEPAGASLLAWYDRHHRDLPWRVPPSRRGERPDPYRVWLSEIMLQQTRVETVRPYFLDFLSRWPDVQALAAASLEEVLAAWAGLGYYSRARNLKRCAGEVVGNHGGRFPHRADELARLPGIGPYTAAAIAAIAFGEPVVPVDGNIRRVMMRLHAINLPRTEAHSAIAAAASAILPRERPGDFAQALMDLGSAICTPRSPDCAACPLHPHCRAATEGSPEAYPPKGPRKQARLRRGAAFLAIRADGAILLERRPQRGILAGMAGLPGSAWSAARDGETGVSAAPFPACWRETGRVTHVFTHFTLELALWCATGIDLPAPPGCWWAERDSLASEALPALFRKAVEKGAAASTVRRR